MKIRQDSTFLLTLLKDVANGRVLPAAMQRPYVWSKLDVEALCDSIVCGFPVGTFLMWSPCDQIKLNRVAKSRLGPITPSQTNAAQPTYLLLDGQNRLATLGWMMLKEAAPDMPDASAAEQLTWLSNESLVVDHATKSIKFIPSDQTHIGLRLPAWTLIEPQGAMPLILEKMSGPWAKDHTESQIDEFVRFWDQCCLRFQNARTAQTTIEDATPEQAKHAFMRICKVGVPMSASDFDHALNWAASATSAGSCLPL